MYCTYVIYLIHFYIMEVGIQKKVSLQINKYLNY